MCYSQPVHFACGDGNRSSAREDDATENEEAIEDNTTMESDTASVWDRDRDGNADRMDRDEAGTGPRVEGDTTATREWHHDVEKDSIQ